MDGPRHHGAAALQRLAQRLQGLPAELRYYVANAPSVLPHLVPTRLENDTTNGGHAGKIFSMRQTVGKIISIVCIAGAAIVGVARAVLDLIGYSTIPEDAQVATGLLRDFLILVLSLPWWVPWGFALISTMWLMWVSWRQPQIEHTTESKYLSPFSGKEQSKPGTIPSRFIEIIDRDDREISNRIRLHMIPKPIQVHRYLDAPDPYFIITIHLWNNSLFELKLVSVRGRFSYKSHALQNEPELLDSIGIILTRYEAKPIRLRQYITPHVAEQLRDWSECESATGDVFLTFQYKNRLEEEKTVDFHVKGKCHLVSIQ